MPDSRPDPEELLARVKEQELEASRGKLKIFLGAAAGVGKTYKMLESARELANDGLDVVAGCVVTHGRKDTEALLVGLEIVAPRVIEYRGTKLEEFDIDAVLTRRPTFVLVDELAHTNVPECRHEKRWQDVEELLEAGINVYTTMNVQHLESANDIVASITHVTVRETVPDSLFEKAYEIELVDLPPDELIQRLKEGKVYVPEQSKSALENFFRKGNLIALRELALRAAAERVDKQMLKYRSDEFVKDVWPASERILVCIGPSPLSIKLVRAARRMAYRLDAEWLAVYVQTPGSTRLPEKDRNRLTSTMQLAEQLGAEVVVIPGTSPSEELVAYAHERNISKIIIGKPAKSRWKEVLFGSVVDEVIRRSGDIDVYVITGLGDPAEEIVRERTASKVDYRAYGKAMVLVFVATAIARVMFGQFALVNLVMIYQLAVVLIAVRYGTGAAIMSSVLSVAVCDYFFVPPYQSFAVSDSEYLFTLAVMLITALTLSTLTSNVRRQAEMARKRERRMSALYAMTRSQAVALSTNAVVTTSVKNITEVFDCRAVVCLADEQGKLSLVPDLEGSFDVGPKEFGVAQWVLTNGQMAGAGTSTLPGANGSYLPLIGSKGPIGVIGILVADPKRIMYPEEKHLLDTFVNQTALAIERARLSEEARKAHD